MTKPKLFEPLNAPISNTVPNSWRSLIVQLENDFRISILQSDAVLMSDTLFRMSDLHWFVKLAWDGSHKIPLPCSSEPLFKARGKLLQSIASLAKECHFRAVPESLGYSNPVDWVAGILFEGVLWCAEGENKPEGIRNTQKHNKDLRTLNNPYDRDTHPHTWNLIEASIQWAESRSVTAAFKELWQKFLDNKVLETRSLESPYFIPVTRGKKGEFYTVASPKSKGQGKLLLSAAMFKNGIIDSKYSHAGELKALLCKPSGY